MIEILRLSHRIRRDPRISTHVALVARAFGADKIYYSGDHDLALEDSVNKIVKQWGSNFQIEYIKDPIKLIKSTKSKIINLTMYGLPLENEISKIKKFKDLLIIIGGEKVPIEIYKLSDYNISVTQQPHSEVSSLAIFLHEFFKGEELKLEFKNPKVKITPQISGKKTTTFI